MIRFDFYTLFWTFFLGCFLGVVIETFWSFFQIHRFESRKGLVLGPFNLIYGFGALIITVSLSWLGKGYNWLIVVFGAVIGGIYEYVCSCIQIKLFQTVSWDYKDFKLNLHGKINFVYCVFWGILSLFCVRCLYPFVSQIIWKIPELYIRLLTVGGLIFIVIDTVLSACVVHRKNSREKNTGQTNKFWEYIDRYYPDEKIEKIYPNMKKI